MELSFTRWEMTCWSDWEFLLRKASLAPAAVKRRSLSVRLDCVCLGVALFEFILLGVELLECPAAAAYYYCYYQFWDSWPLFLQVVFLPLFCHLGLVCAGLLNDIPQSLRLCSVFSFLPSFFSGWIISTEPFAGLLILSSANLHLLLSPSIEFLFQLYFFNSELWFSSFL